jgi:hypothetical protein
MKNGDSPGKRGDLKKLEGGQREKRAVFLTGSTIENPTPIS